jgi:hypothetical protein
LDTVAAGEYKKLRHACAEVVRFSVIQNVHRASSSGWN